MDRIFFAVVVGVLLSASALGDAQTAPIQTSERDALEVRILSPHAGIVDGEHTFSFHAEVAGADVAVLTLNGISFEVPVNDGRVEQELVASPGNNRVALRVSKEGESAEDSRTFFFRGAAVELIVLLSFPANGEIIDLWVREPGGETCKWDHRATESGGALLDFSSSAIGFGSQAYVLDEVRPGRFRVKVHYWGGTAGEGPYVRDDLLRRLDTVEARLAALPTTPSSASERVERAEAEQERQRTVARLDEWARPHAPQTPVHAEVVLFPSTAHERRFRFDVVADRVGRLTTVGEVEIDAAMIEAARRSL